MTQQLLYEWITHPEQLNRDTLYELRTLLARYPYFQTARLLYLKNLFLLHDITFGEELRRAALYIADRKVLFYMIEGEHFRVQSQASSSAIAEQPDLDRTLSLIDAFLSEHAEEKPEYLEASMVVPMEVATDYTSFLMREETGLEVPQMVGQELIDEFLEKTSEEQPSASKLQPEAEKQEEILPIEEPDEMLEGQEMEDEGYFTETLAKIYVKQGRYSKALEIIKKLNLKYPKKNAYFADQIRFLEKLIINTKSK